MGVEKVREGQGQRKKYGRKRKQFSYVGRKGGGCQERVVPEQGSRTAPILRNTHC